MSINPENLVKTGLVLSKIVDLIKGRKRSNITMTGKQGWLKR